MADPSPRPVGRAATGAGVGAGVGTEWVRRRNVALVLRALRRAGPASRAELASRTGLAKATVGSIVADLEAVGAVGEPVGVGSGDRARGRPSRPVTLLGDRFATLGLELNVDYVAAVLLDLAGEVRHHETRPLPPATDPLAALAALTRELLVVTGGESGHELVGVTVAVPGLVRDDDRSVAWAPNLTTAGDEVADRVERALGTARPGSVQVWNDADCAAYAEAQVGAAAGEPSLLYLTGTVGVGAGIVEAGTLVRGGRGFAGEVGHLPLGDPGQPCGCGRRGCWETAVGLHAMLRAVGRPELDTPLGTAVAVAAAATRDPAVRAGLERVGADLGRGLAVLAGVLDPAVVVLGGYFVPLGELVLAPARAAMHERGSAPGPGPELRLGALGIEAAALGAAQRAFAGVFAGERELAR